MFITVIICTIGRKSILNTITSIFNNNFKDFELIIVSQGKDNLNLLNKIKTFKNLRVYKLNNIGLSRARNYGIQKSTGNIIAFTDDDCVASKNWLHNLNNEFSKNSTLDGVFGQVIPYKPKLNPGLKTISCVSFRKEKIYKGLPIVRLDFLIGANMAFRKSTFDKYGIFKTWLGTGSVGFAAEDEEFANRILESKGKILTSDKPKVYHNRWLTKDKHQKVIKNYILGFVMLYTYKMLSGKKYAALLLKKFLIKDLSIRFKKAFNTFNHGRPIVFLKILFETVVVVYRYVYIITMASSIRIYDYLKTFTLFKQKNYIDLKIR